jgi:RNA polymerase sigma-70 factor (ECF subfamily)
VQLDPQEGQHHSPEEAEEAILGLAKEYWLRLHRWATWRLTGNCMAEADEVIANVYERFCTGSRRWPIGVKIGTCFWNAVKSTISGEWDKHKRRLVRQYSPITAEGDAADPFEEVLDTAAPVEEPVDGPLEEMTTADERRRYQTMLDHIESSFAADEAVTAVLIGLEQELPAREIQEAFNLTETQYDSARKRLRRFINKHYPNGWRSYGQRQQEPENLA